MKKLFFTFLALFSASFMFGQVVISSDITASTTWTANNIYELHNFVYVTNGATLTIEPGTVIMGDSSSKGTLIVTRGSKLIANGTVEKPIVFTTNQPAGSRVRGSWGGVVLLGKATINVPGGETVVEGGVDLVKGLYGGNDDADNSGSLKYVRIEYAGIPFQPNQEINGLTLGGVGSSTTLDHIMVTESNDDSYEWFGGTVNGKYLICNRGWDDDFDTDFGFRGKVQFGVVVRDPAIADPGSSSSAAFESDNDGSGSANTPQTAAVFSNITVVGPLETSSTSINPNFVRALQIRRNSALSVFNSGFAGYPNGLYIDGAASGTNATNGDLVFKNNTLAGMTLNYKSNSSFDINTWIKTTGFNDDTLPNSKDLLLTDAYNFSNVDLRPKTGSPLLTGASFTDAKVKDPFFTTTTYRGAFDGTTDWTDCWCKWDPQNEDYSKGVDYTAVADFNVTMNGAVATVTNNSTGATSYTWDFGDPNSNNDVFNTQNAGPYTYTSNGTYNISLTVRHNDCPVKKIQKTVQVTSLVSQKVVIAGDITASTTWTNDKIYELKNFVYVTGNSTLTIEKGTIVMGDSATKGTLIVSRGSKLIANGTDHEPIVFTTNQPAGSRVRGSWGGVVLLGKATINVPGGETVVEGGVDPVKGLYGGNDDADNSGSLKYVRIEYAGIPFQPNQEINGLTLGGVGSGTTLDHIMVTEANDDSYEWFGGTVNGKYLICNRGWDDDFDTDFGFRGKVQFGVVVRDPAIADPGSGSSSAFESDNDGGGSANTPQTAAVFSNITVVGPLETPTTPINPNFVRALQIRRNSALSVFNSGFAGYPNGLFIDGTASGTNATNGTLVFKNNVLAGFTRNFQSNSTFDISSWVKNGGFNIDTLPNSTDLKLNDAYNFNNTDLRPATGSPLLSGASFTDAKLQGGYFATTTYRGAFAENDTWTDCWTKWNPQGETYNSAIKYVAATAQGTYQPNSFSIKFNNTSLNADKYLWDFGTGDKDTATNPTYVYPADGTYTVKLYALSGCGNDSTTITVTVTDVPKVARKVEAKVYPNPAQNTVNVEFNVPVTENVKVSVIDITGKTVAAAAELDGAFGQQNVSFNTSDLSNGVYFINIASPSAVGTYKFIIIK
jgi:PKD repeat protein